MKKSKWIMFALMAITVAVLPHLAVAEPQFRKDELLNGLVGKYILLGKWVKSGVAYSGSVTLKRSGDKLLLTRTVGKNTAHGTITFGKSEEGAPVLALRFEQDKQAYKGTYLWIADLNNYFRLTGDLYFTKGSKETRGVEALFPDSSAE